MVTYMIWVIPAKAPIWYKIIPVWYSLHPLRSTLAKLGFVAFTSLFLTADTAKR